MRGGYVPVDEGEAEAQPALPPMTIRLLDSPERLDKFPRRVRMEVEGGSMRRAALDGYLIERASAWLATMGYAFEGDDRPAWADTEDGRVRALTYTLTGWT